MSQINPFLPKLLSSWCFITALVSLTETVVSECSVHSCLVRSLGSSIMWPRRAVPSPLRSQEAGKEPGEGIGLKTYPSDLLPAARPHPLIFPCLPKQHLQVQTKHPAQEPVGGSSHSSHGKLKYKRHRVGKDGVEAEGPWACRDNSQDLPLTMPLAREVGTTLPVGRFL